MSICPGTLCSRNAQCLGGSWLPGAHTEQADATALLHPQRAAALPLAWQACSLVLNLSAGGTAGCPSGLGVGTAGTVTPPQSQNSWVKSVDDTKCLVSWAAPGFAPGRPPMMKAAKFRGGPRKMTQVSCWLIGKGFFIVLGEGSV